MDTLFDTTIDFWAFVYSGSTPFGVCSPLSMFIVCLSMFLCWRLWSPIDVPMVTLDVPDVLMCMSNPRCSYEQPSMFLWATLDVLMTNPRCSYGQPSMFLLSNIDVIMATFDIIMVNPQCPYGHHWFWYGHTSMCLVSSVHYSYFYFSLILVFFFFLYILNI
jgi:hypothetical protein